MNFITNEFFFVVTFITLIIIIFICSKYKKYFTTRILVSILIIITIFLGNAILNDSTLIAIIILLFSFNLKAYNEKNTNIINKYVSIIQIILFLAILVLIFFKI